MPLACVFFDVGNTLGSVDANLDLHLYGDTVALLKELRALGLRLGVISNVPPAFTANELAAMLAKAQIDTYFEPALIIASRGGADAKPAPAIYQRAAVAAGVAIADCMFVGEDIAEVIGAHAAGMSTQHKTRH